jgi:hypothetical protein
MRIRAEPPPSGLRSRSRNGGCLRSALGHSRRFSNVRGMSALPQLLTNWLTATNDAKGQEETSLATLFALKQLFGQSRWRRVSCRLRSDQRQCESKDCAASGIPASRGSSA